MKTTTLLEKIQKHIDETSWFEWGKHFFVHYTELGNYEFPFLHNRKSSMEFDSYEEALNFCKQEEILGYKGVLQDDWSYDKVPVHLEIDVYDDDHISFIEGIYVSKKTFLRDRLPFKGYD